MGSTGWFGFNVGVSLPVPVGIHDERRPALGFLFISGFVEHLRVQPADHLSATTRPERVVRVLGKHQMVGAETGADVRDLLCLRIVDGQVPARVRNRIQFRGWMLRAFAAESRVLIGRTAEVSQIRPFSSNMGLWTLLRLVHMASLPQYTEGCGTFAEVRGSALDREPSMGPCWTVAHRIQHRHVVGT